MAVTLQEDLPAVCIYVASLAKRRSEWPRWFKAWVCGLSLAGIAGSNPAEDMDVCLL